jgi:hypothetical protein
MQGESPTEQKGFDLLNKFICTNIGRILREHLHFGKAKIGDTGSY